MRRTVQVDLYVLADDPSYWYLQMDGTSVGMGTQISDTLHFNNIKDTIRAMCPTTVSVDFMLREHEVSLRSMGYDEDFEMEAIWYWTEGLARRQNRLITFQEMLSEAMGDPVPPQIGQLAKALLEV